ncbi:uncharacterized protein EURHEDRAFT_191243 [Aspergillus ruber CBS 135680]|uniref:Uncharacterized protein n=1 Tax=Aspergillus ruber (strain CBS 135680) TaxID=1388766 RepID=A0A017S845_ASPRC|nr:uncharacterized protein EURHEDRAFT_191243 [Aspergillus ruber CBS 135680]EYE92355.1 hypothetical protein EURHEDRAFT_191243 [Aspergillus ruber CBS 135680]
MVLSFGDYLALRLARFQGNGSITQEPSPNQSPSGTIDLSIPITGRTRRLVVPQTFSVTPGPIHLLQKCSRLSGLFLFYSSFKHQEEGKKKDKSAGEGKDNLSLFYRKSSFRCVLNFFPTCHPRFDHGRGLDFANKRGQGVEGNAFSPDAATLLSHSEQWERSHP